MVAKNILILYILLIATLCEATTIQFKQSIGGNSPEYGYCARQTYDNGYISVGSTSSIGNGNTDIYVVKTDSNGIVMWSQTFGSSNIEVGRFVEELKDSSLIIVGYTNNTNGNGYDVDLLRLDRWGNKVWERNYGGADWEFAYSVHQTLDGGFIIAGGTYSYGKGNEDMYLIKTDINGDTLWTKTYGGIEDDEAKSVRETSDGGFILAGFTKSFADINGDAYVIKINSIGDTLWTKTYGGAKEDLANDIIECKNGDYAFCGRTNSYSNRDANQYLNRIQSNGIIKWMFKDGKDSVYDSFEAIVETLSGKLVCAGTTSSYGGGKDDGSVLMLDSTGNYISTGNPFPNDKYFGSSCGTAENEQFYSIAITSDNGFILCGFTDSTKIGFNVSNLFLVKTDSVGTFPQMKFLLSTKDIANDLIISIKAYPNPFSIETHLQIKTETKIDISNFKLLVTDVNGRECILPYNISNFQDNNIELQLEKGSLTQGIYFIHCYLKQQLIGNLKVIIE